MAKTGPTHGIMQRIADVGLEPRPVLDNIWWIRHVSGCCSTRSMSFNNFVSRHFVVGKREKNIGLPCVAEKKRSMDRCVLMSTESEP